MYGRREDNVISNITHIQLLWWLHGTTDGIQQGTLPVSILTGYRNDGRINAACNTCRVIMWLKNIGGKYLGCNFLSNNWVRYSHPIIFPAANGVWTGLTSADICRQLRNNPITMNKFFEVSIFTSVILVEKKQEWVKCVAAQWSRSRPHPRCATSGDCLGDWEMLDCRGRLIWWWCNGRLFVDCSESGPWLTVRFGNFPFRSKSILFFHFRPRNLCFFRFRS